MRGPGLSDGDARRLFRIAAGLLFNRAKFDRWGLDFIDALIMMAVTQANVAPIMADPVLQRRYATYDALPPDELRRPISIHATAHSLGLSYETVRRRVTRLARLGVYRVGAEGVVVPGGHLRRLSHKRALEETYARLRDLYRRLRAEGLIDEVASRDEHWPAPPVRVAARICGAYLLRFTDELTGHLGDLACGVVWLSAFRCNREHWPDSAAGEGDLRPVRVTELARRLGLPAETVRRRAAQLVAQGACAWTPAGLVVSDAILGEPAFARLVARSRLDLTQMYAALAQFGVVAAWRAEAD